MHIKTRKLPQDSTTDISLLPSEIFESLGLSIDVKYNLHLGQLNELSYIKPDNTKYNYMYFPREIFDKLLLYSDANLCIWRKDKDIYLGPVIGVFVNTRFLKDIEDGEPRESAQRHIQANEAGKCLIYYFTIDNINWMEKKIKGFTYIPEYDKWVNYWFPIPDVIYDRATRFDTDQKLLVNHIREQFRYNPNIYFINSRDYLAKWSLHKCLCKYNEINKYLPKTIVYEKFNDVLLMLREHEFIFIKSSLGSMGMDVLSIEIIDSKYKLTMYSSGLKEYIINDIEELRKLVETYTKGRLFIIQQGIKLMKYNGRSMDMRILIEKDGGGNWTVIYNQCRIAKGSLTITNASTGGDLANYEDVYKELTDKLQGVVIPNYDELAKITVEIATFIEKEYGSFGEIGMDMALDEKGIIWFLEANSKPDKCPEPGLEDTEGISPQFLSILEYARFLTKGE